MTCTDRILKADWVERRLKIQPFCNPCHQPLTSLPGSLLTRTTSPVTLRHAAMALLASPREDSTMVALVVRLQSWPFVGQSPRLAVTAFRLRPA